MKRKLPTVLPRLAHTVPHVTQLDSWDCGLACLAMVLAGAHNSGLIADDPTKTNPLSLRTIMEASGAGESVWTIDLAYIMRHFGIDDFTFYTSYIGVNLQYTGKHFYRESISNDRRRIHSLFAEAQDFGVRVVPMVLSMEDMRRFLLSEHYAILILVNLRKLKCRVCSRHHGSSSSPFSRPITSFSKNDVSTSTSSALKTGELILGKKRNLRSSAIAGTADNYLSYYSKYLCLRNPVVTESDPTSKRHCDSSSPGYFKGAFRNVFGCCLPTPSSPVSSPVMSSRHHEEAVDTESGYTRMQAEFAGAAVAAEEGGNTSLYGALDNDGAPNGVGRVRRHTGSMDGLGESAPLLGQAQNNETSAGVTGLVSSFFGWFSGSKEYNPSVTQIEEGRRQMRMHTPSAYGDHHYNPPMSGAGDLRRSSLDAYRGHRVDDATVNNGLPSIFGPTMSPPQTPPEDRRNSRSSDDSRNGALDTLPVIRRPSVGSSPSKQPSQFFLTPLLGSVFFTGEAGKTVTTDGDGLHDIVSPVLEEVDEDIESFATQSVTPSVYAEKDRPAGIWNTAFSWMYAPLPNDGSGMSPPPWSNRPNGGMVVVESPERLLDPPPPNVNVRRGSINGGASPQRPPLGMAARRNSITPVQAHSPSKLGRSGIPHRSPSTPLGASSYQATNMVTRGRTPSPALRAVSAPDSPTSADDFMGHYVLLIGYDPETDGILVRDPGTEEGVCFVDASVLDAARSAPGTDHDAIVVRVR